MEAKHWKYLAILLLVLVAITQIKIEKNGVKKSILNTILGK